MTVVKVEIYKTELQVTGRTVDGTNTAFVHGEIIFHSQNKIMRFGRGSKISVSSQWNIISVLTAKTNKQ